LNFGESGNRGVVIVAIEDDGRVTTERHSVAISHVYDLKIDVTACASKQEIRERVAAALEGRGGYARLTLTGELAPVVDLHITDFEDLPNSLDSPPIIRLDSLTVSYDLVRIRQEPTVRGQFVRDVQASPLSAQERQRIIVTGLRALDGRADLEVF
jgi:hypothetical protein